MKICELWMICSERFAAVYGAPLPKELLTLGDARGWQATLNNCGETRDGIQQFHVHAYWNEWPAGIMDPSGGCIAAGDAANEESFRAWLPTAERPKAAA